MFGETGMFMGIVMNGIHRSTLLIAALVALAFAFAACSSQRSATSALDMTTTVIVVRHAEAVADGSPDPPLSEAGRKRADALASRLADSGIDAIYTTQFARTKQTAAPLAARLSIVPTERPAEAATMETYATTLAEEILLNHAGGTVLVVGHSNTVPQLVEALSGRAVAPMRHDEHDRVTTITIVPATEPLVEESTFGS